MLITVVCFPRQAQPSQVYFTGEVKGEEAIKSESEIGSAVTHQFRVSTEKLRNHFLYRVASSLLCPAFYRYIRFTLIIRTISSEVGHCSCLDLQIINLGKRLTETVTLEIDWPKETEVVGKWLLYLMKINSTGVEHIECSPKGEINPRNMVSENITLRCGGHSACTYTFSKSSLGMW